MFGLILFDLNKSLGKRKKPLLPWAEIGRPTMETGELPRSIALPAVVTAGWRLVGDEAMREASREHLSVVSSSLWGTGRKGAHRKGPPPHIDAA
jgi:hypothetical protein